MMVIDNKYNIEDLVYLKTDTQQLVRIVVSLTVDKNDIMYKLSCGTETTDHYAYEINKEIDVLKSISND